ncbi:hypothetical protein HBI55_102750 [Parastagonospora nodorum]|nr:hypothetical protein HBI55_102750 [Parastagonospora nodorum]
MDFANLLSNAKLGDDNKNTPAALPVLPEKPASIKKIKTPQATTPNATTTSKVASVFKMDMPLPTASFKSVTGATIQAYDKPSEAVSFTAQPSTRGEVASPIREPDAPLRATSPGQPKDVTSIMSFPVSRSETPAKAAATKSGPIAKETIIKAESTTYSKQITVVEDDTTANASKAAKEVSTLSKDITPLRSAISARQGPTPGREAAAASTAKLQSSMHEPRMSLARLKSDAAATIKERLMAVGTDYDKFVAIISNTKGKKVKEAVEDALREAMKTLAAQREALEKDHNKLKSFGEGFDLAKIKRIDAQALVALSYWSDATVNWSRFDTVPAAVPARAVALGAAPLGNTASKGASKDKPLNIDEKIKKPSPPKKAEVQRVSQATAATPKQDVLPPPSPTDKPARKPARKSSAMVPPKRVGAKTAISRPTKRVPVSLEQATKKTVILDMEEVVDAQAIGTVAEAKRTVKTGKGGFAKARPKGRLSSDYDGLLKIRKNAPTVVGEKRKRGDMTGVPNKRSAIEGRNFKPLRTRHAPPILEGMDTDTEPAPSCAIFSLTV